MASQNRDPAAASVAAVRKGAEPCGGAARGPVGKRLQQELMILMTSGSCPCETPTIWLPRKGLNNEHTS
uniref:Uncharacterized protein n=1 Tax=Mus spicilegus TaxID=10103 RepID=A0A8C6IB13_MUSSI